MPHSRLARAELNLAAGRVPPAPEGEGMILRGLFDARRLASHGYAVLSKTANTAIFTR